MRWLRQSVYLLPAFVMVLSTAVVLPASAAAQEVAVAEVLSEALGFYNELEFDKGLELASGLLKRSDLTAHDSAAIYEVFSIITYAKGETYFQEALNYLDKISKIGPCVVPLPRDIWPQELRDRWYQILKAKGSLICDEKKSDVKTIAIMRFDNFSSGEYQEKLGLISKGLADFFAFDFARISSFKVVERDKIDFILKEIELQQSGAVDRATAVQVGKILGARYMVFGSITQLDYRQTRMVVRVVDVETSEIIAWVDKEGKPEYAKMEKEIVRELSEKLEVKLDEPTLTLLDEGGTDSDDATQLYATGLEYMDKYNYKQAYEYFKKAYEMDESFTEAKRKMEIYQPLVG